MRSLVLLIAATSLAAATGCSTGKLHVYVPGPDGSITCPSEYPIKVSKENVVYGPWLRPGYGAVVALRCYDSVPSAQMAGAQVVSQNK